MSGSTTAALVNGVTTSTYDANDRLTSGVHSYDADGNETTVNGQGASYDFENHLIGLSGGTSYTYDADGNRVGVTTGGATTSYVVDTSLPYASVVEEYSGSTLMARYDYGDDLVRMDRTSGLYYYLYDGLGSTRQLVGTGGAVMDGYSYDAFGEGLSHGPNSGVLNPFLFNAQQFDAATQTYYLRARYYDPTSGRFLSQDPFGGNDQDPISLHRYLYASSEPIDNIDPSGNFDFSLSSTLAAASVVGTLSSVYNFIEQPNLVTGAELAASLIPGGGFVKILKAAGSLKGFGELAQIAIGLKKGIPVSSLTALEPSAQAAVSWMAAHGTQFIVWAGDKTIGKIIGRALGAAGDVKRADVLAQDLTDGSYVLISAKTLLSVGELKNAIAGLESTIEGLDKLHELGGAATTASEAIDKVFITFKETKDLAKSGYRIESTGKLYKGAEEVLVKGKEVFAKQLNF